MFCVFLNVRYANEKLMHVGHSFLIENFDYNDLINYYKARFNNFTFN